MRVLYRSIAVSLAGLALLSGCGSFLGGNGSTQGQETGSVCGNGILEPGEQCDDGNLVNLDGCDSTCHFEQIQRLNSLTVLYGPDSICTQDALGSSVGSAAQSQVQSAISGAVQSGAVSALLQFIGLTDLSGVTNQTFTLGSMSGTPVGVDAGYNGTSDLDWWYTASASDVTGNNVPINQSNGAIADGGLSAGPGAVTLPLSIGGGTSQLQLSSVILSGEIGSASAPTAEVGSQPQGHRTSEHDDPTLSTFAGISNGEMCGNISAASLATLPVPSELLSGSTSCSQGYTSQNSMLDVFVGGCTVFIVTAVSSTQPDQVDPSVPDAGTGPYTLSADSNSLVVNGCTDSTGTSIPLPTCLAAAAYSGAFQFTADRVEVIGVQ